MIDFWIKFHFEKQTFTHHDGVAIDGSLELREVRLHALVGRQGDVPHLDPEVVAGLFCFVEVCWRYAQLIDFTLCKGVAYLVECDVRRAGDDHVGPLDAPLGTGQVAVGLAGHQTALRPSGSHLPALSMSLTDVQLFQDVRAEV